MLWHRSAVRNVGKFRLYVNEDHNNMDHKHRMEKRKVFRRVLLSHLSKDDIREYRIRIASHELKKFSLLLNISFFEYTLFFPFIKKLLKPANSMCFESNACFFSMLALPFLFASGIYVILRNAKFLDRIFDDIYILKLMR
ncbi:MAG: hypothetical protein QXS91_01805 [Candidatus Anstonellales archaeon]